jgi:hypothetical protein
MALKCLYCGSDGDDVNEYTLSTGFDVSTASFVDAFRSFTRKQPRSGLAFNTDGTKMFIVGLTNDGLTNTHYQQALMFLLHLTTL